jgi:glycyl-tRNA synthetase beta chain
MKQNQKYFPLVDGRGKLLNRFLIVSNMPIAHPQNIVHGNERVLRARLADAKFFYEQDRRVRLESRVPGLANVVYYRTLGSQLDRVRRLEALAGVLALQLGVDERLARRAAHLSKSDLLTGMVGEFPELQGLMGSYYAAHDGEPRPVVRALADQYRVRLDDIADDESLVSGCLYAADRIEMLVGMFGTGNAPTGEKDPYGLRRAANGLISVFELLGSTKPFSRKSTPDLRQLLVDAVALFPKGAIGLDVPDQVFDFVLDRYRYQLASTYPKDTIEAVLAKRPNLTDVVARVRAVEAFRKLPEADSLAAANKRIRNILRKSDAFERGIADPALLREEAERALHSAVGRIRSDVEHKAAAREYADSLRLLADVRPQVDKFFDEVLVNAEDAALRRNRLRLLADLDHILNQVADISKLAT